MDFSTLADSLQNALGPQLLSILGATGVLVVGWLAAVLLRAGLRRSLGALFLNRRIAESAGQKVDIEGATATAGFWLVILITLIGVFNTLNLPLISGPFETLVGQIVGYAPRLIAGTVLVLVAWLVATVLRAVVNRVFAATQLDEKLAAQAAMQPMSQSVGDMLYWLVILLFVPAILGAYGITGLLDPIKAMVWRVLDLLPNIFAAIVIGFVGWLLGRVLSGLTRNILSAAGADAAGQRLGVDASISLSRLAGTIVLILVFVPALIAALDVLRIQAISGPAIEMLKNVMAAVPHIIAAALILTITYYVARCVSRLLARLMNSLGFDTLPEKMGLAHLFSDAWRPSRLVGAIVLFFAMLFATVEAANRLDFTQVRDVVTTFIRFGGDILLGGAILTIGFWLSALAATAIQRAGGPSSAGMARLARAAILGLIIAMGLRAMGIADDIVNLAFALTLGAVAVAVALSFGLGGREAAGRQMEHWLSKLRKDA